MAICAQCPSRKPFEPDFNGTVSAQDTPDAGPPRTNIARIGPNQSIFQFFDSVFVISSKRLPHRLDSFHKKIEACGWPFCKPSIWESIDHENADLPRDFKQGRAAYARRQSHVGILHHCLMHNIKSVLILEENVNPVPNFADSAALFLNRIPSDWDGIMFGGQHHEFPIAIGNNILRVVNAHRTYAYAARGHYLQALYTRWVNATVHIDWLMTNWQSRYRVYAPRKWLIHQSIPPRDKTAK